MRFIIDILEIVYEYKIRFKEDKDKLKVTDEFIKKFQNIQNKKKI